jgi:hypothetical protein
MLVGGSLRSVLLACSMLLLGVSMMCLSTGVGMQMVDNTTLLQTRIVLCSAAFQIWRTHTTTLSLLFAVLVARSSFVFFACLPCQQVLGI